MTTRGFSGRRPSDDVARRLPPGQYETKDFPVLAKGPTPRVDLATWRFTINDGPRPLASWTWAEFEALPQTTWRGDIHCVTKWSKLDTTWSGVTIDDLLQAAGIAPPTRFSAGANRTTTTTPTSRLPIWSAARRWSRRASPARRSRPSMAGRQDFSFRISISGRARSGSRACASPHATRRGSGSCAAITCTVIPGASSATPNDP